MKILNFIVLIVFFKTAGIYGHDLSRTGVSNAARNQFSFTPQGTEAEPLEFTKHPALTAVCSETGTSMTVVATGADSYQWQVSTDYGANFADLAEGSVYAQVTEATLLIVQSAGLANNWYRCVISGADGSLESNPAVLDVWDCSGCKVAQPSAGSLSILTFSFFSTLLGIQTFTPDCDSEISAITVYNEIGTILSGSNLTLSLRTADNPTARTAATLLGSASRSGILPLGPLIFTFSEPIPVTSGTLYQFDFTYSGLFGGQLFVFASSENNSYDGGRFAADPYNGFSESIDLKFQVEATQILPVILVSFSGKKNEENQVNLKWTTSDESAFDHFQIQRSSNAKSFETIASIKGAAKPGYQLQNYHFTDVHPGAGSYYRLKMVDQDGSLTYSQIISTGIGKRAPVVGVSYPNPSPDNTSYVDIESPSDAEWTISTFDLTGKTLYSGKRLLKAGTNKVSIPQLKTGLNLIRFDTDEGASFTRKVVR